MSEVSKFAGVLGGIRGEESTAGLHQNAKISFNKGKVWKRGEETWLERLRAKTVCAPPPPPCLFPLRCTNSWYLAFVVVSNDCPGIALSSIDNCINFFFFYLYSKDVSFANRSSLFSYLLSFIIPFLVIFTHTLRICINIDF